jgi:hypothetical protein
MSKETIADSASPSLRVAATAEERAVVTGPESLSDADLVVLVLGAARRELPVLAAALDDGGVAALARLGIGELAQRKGIGRVRAVRLAASVELGRRAILAASLEAPTTAADNSLTFLMTNMHPQRPELNRVTWKALEEHERALAKKHHELYVVAGGIFDATSPTIGHGVQVPKAEKSSSYSKKGKASAPSPRTPSWSLS